MTFSDYFCGNISRINQVNICRIIAAVLTAVAGLTYASAQINVDQVVRVGRNALYFEDYVLSIQYFNQAIAAKPYLAQPYFYRAIAKYSLDDMAGAAADASLAIERNPFITDAYEIRGVARQNTGDIEGAIADYNKVLDMMPVNKGVLFNLAMAQQDAGQPDSAEVTFRRLFKLSPGYERAHIGYARLLLERGDTAAAADHVDRALEINRFNVNAIIFHANLALGRGKEGYATALADMDEAIRLEPRQPSFFVNRAYLRHELDDYYGAMSDFDYALQLDPVNTPALFNRAILRAEVGDHDRAIADLDKVVALTGARDYRALFNRAMINRERGFLKEALADAETIVSAFPDMPAAYFLRFEIREAMGDRNARADYDRSIAMARSMKEHREDDTASAATPSGASATADKRRDDPFFNFDPEDADAVAGRFNSLVTMDTSADATDIVGALGTAGPAAQRQIRGRVQDDDASVELEPMFVVTYYTSPTELKPSGDYMREAEEVNKTRILRYLLQVTNHESPLTDPADIDRHFASVDYYTSYIATHPPRAIDYFGRGMDFMTVRDYAKAIADFTEAARLSPDFTLAYFMRSIARMRHAEAEAASVADGTPRAQADIRRYAAREAIADIDTVIALSPTLAVAHYNKGVIYAVMGDYTSALNAFTSAIGLKPDMGEAYFNRGYTYFKLGNAAAGTSDLSHAGQLGIVPSYSLLKRMRQ